jgi:hypothetical protein
VSDDRRRTRRPPSAAAIEFDTFSVAVGLAIVAGGLALVVPYLNGLTVALVALAAAGWAAGRASASAHRIFRTLSSQATGLLAAIAGAGAFFLLPDPFAHVRGLLFSLSLLPLWWTERRGTSGTPARETRVV